MSKLSVYSRAAFYAWLLLSPFSLAHAHPGSLNKEGCHNDRKNGGYHCHRSASVPKYTAPRSDYQPARLAPSSAAANSATAYNGRVFRNCDEARAAGAAPVHRGDPGYGPHLDRDNDGVGCEPYRGR